MLQRLFGVPVLSVLLWLAAAPAQATAVIENPAAGGHSVFVWEAAGALSGIFDAGPDDGVSSETGSTDWQLALAAPGLLGIVISGVYNRPPTVLDLLIDGIGVPWTTSSVRAEVISEDDQGVPLEIIHHFDARLDGLLLAAGEHRLTLLPSADNTDGTAGFITFAAIVPVPAPPALALLAAGFGLVVALRARRTAKAA